MKKHVMVFLFIIFSIFNIFSYSHSLMFYHTCDLREKWNDIKKDFIIILKDESKEYIEENGIGTIQWLKVYESSLNNVSYDSFLSIYEFLIDLQSPDDSILDYDMFYRNQVDYIIGKVFSKRISGILKTMNLPVLTENNELYNSKFFVTLNVISGNFEKQIMELQEKTVDDITETIMTPDLEDYLE